jgi:hypothetical protein
VWYVKFFRYAANVYVPTAHQFIGLGAQDPQDPSNIIPIAVFAAQPGSQNIITPKPKYYISWGSFNPGRIIDVATIAEPCVIDFSDNTADLANVEHHNDGTWTVTYK